MQHIQADTLKKFKAEFLKARDEPQIKKIFDALCDGVSLLEDEPISNVNMVLAISRLLASFLKFATETQFQTEAEREAMFNGLLPIIVDELSKPLGVDVHFTEAISYKPGEMPSGGKIGLS